AEAGDLLRMKSCESAAEIVALAQDRDPRQPGLETVQHELLVERARIVFRHAPFFVVVRQIQRIAAGPAAADSLLHRRDFFFALLAFLAFFAGALRADVFFAAFLAAAFTVVSNIASTLLPSRS